MNRPSLAGTENSAVWKATSAPPLRGRVVWRVGEGVPLLHDPVEELHREDLESLESAW